MAIEERFFPGSDIESLDLHSFSAIFWDYVKGGKTRAQALAALNATLSEGPLSQAEETDLTTVADDIDAETGETAKLIKVMDYEMVLRQVASGADYQTKAEIRTRLGL